MPSINNLVHETSTGTGTSDIDLVNVSGKQSFSGAFGTGGTDAFYYFISHRTAAEWEAGTGHMSDSNTLVRDTVLASSNSNNAVNFSAGTKDVANDVPAARQGDLYAANTFRAVQTIYADNSSTTPLVKAEQDGTGDAGFTALLTGGVQWTWGIDNSVSGDPWKLSASATLGTTDVLHITTGGSVGVGLTPAVAGSVVQTNVFDVYGQIRCRQGGNGDSDGCFVMGPYGFFSGDNWNGNVMMGYNLATHSTGSADKYRTPYTINGYCAIEMIGPGTTFFYANSGMQSAGSDITPQLTGRISNDGSWYFPLVGTTALGGNAYLNNSSSPANQLLRSTSSIRYKTEVIDITDDDISVLGKLRPIKYHSRAKADDPRKQHFGLIAEEVAEIDERLVLYTRERGKLIPDGVQYERIIPLLVAKIQQLEQRIAKLEAA